MKKTYQAKPVEVERKWYILDASELPFGRVASMAAKLLIGKGKPMFTHHIDVGDFVIVINSEKLVITGNKKAETKSYYGHSQYPGALKTTVLKDKMINNSDTVIIHAIRGMLPVNKLRPARLARLKVYKGAEHQHEAQKPEKLSLGDNK